MDKFLLFLLVFLPIYQDSPLSKYLGAAGYTLVMPLALILIVCKFLITKKCTYNKRLSELWKLGIYLVIISFCAIFIWVLLGNNIVVVSEFLPIKAIKVVMQYFSYPAYISLIIFLVRKNNSDYIGRYSFYTFIALTIICLIEKQQSPYAFRNLHFVAQFPYWRIRLLTTEASWTSLMIYIYSFISLYWSYINKKRICQIICYICAFILVINSGSRTLLLSVAITSIIYIIIAFKKLKKSTVIGIILASFAMIVFAERILPGLIETFRTDIKNYTSLSTRLYTGVIGLMIGIVFPFGVGGAVYLGVLKNALSKYLFVFSKLPVRLKTTEIMTLITKNTDESLTVKSGILHYNMYWGIIGTLFLLNNFKKIVDKLKQNEIKYCDILEAAFLCTIVMILFSCNFTFEFWLLYSYLLCLNEEKEKNNG